MLDAVPIATNQQVDDNDSSESDSESETDHFTMTVVNNMNRYFHCLSVIL